MDAGRQSCFGILAALHAWLACRHTDAVHGREQKTIVRMLEEDKGHTGYLSFATLMHPEARVPLVLRTQSSVETSEQSPSS